MAIYTLDGTDKEINVLGRFASVKNNGNTTVYASSTPDLDDLKAPDIVPIVSGESAVVRDCKKKLYVRGNGQIAVVSGNQPFNFFKPAPKGVGGKAISGFREKLSIAETRTINGFRENFCIAEIHAVKVNEITEKEML